MSAHGGLSALGRVFAPGVSAVWSEGGAWSGGGCAPGGLSGLGGGVSQHALRQTSSVNRMTDRQV